MRASQNPDELHAMLEHLRRKPRNIVVEIGIHKGYSLEVWAKELKPAILLGIEINADEVDTKSVRSIGATVYIGDSHTEKMFKQVQGFLGAQKIDFLFIDGDHTYEGVKRDFDLYKPLVREGGLIGLHDISVRDNETVDVWRFWDEVRYNYSHSTINAKGGTGTGLIFL